MRRTGWLVLIALIAVVTCTDDKNPAAARRELPLAPAVEAPAAATAASSVCRAYQRDLVVVKDQLVRTPEDSDLRASADALGSIITDACN